MKRILTAVLLLTCFVSFGQTLDTTKLISNVGYGQNYKRWKVDSNLIVPASISTVVPRQIAVNGNALIYTASDGTTKTAATTVQNALKLNITDTAGHWQPLGNYVVMQTQSPTATLTGGTTVELMSSGADLSYTLNWSAGRAAATTTSLATANIASITINGVSQTFSNPSAGATVSGTYTGTVVRNINTTFTVTVTTSDGKVSTASTSVISQPKRYWFYSTSATPTSSDVVAALGGGSELSTSISKSSFTITPSGGNQYLSYAYPSSEGALSSINIGGFESIGSFTQRTVSVTNASGYVQNYYVYTSNNQLPTTTINSVN